nr:reverse transcriptase domain-containing protein [Tanacetum cinerariifolium]
MDQNKKIKRGDGRIVKREKEVVPKVDDVSLVDGVFDGAFGGDGWEVFVMGEGMVVSSSSLERLTKSFLSEMMVQQSPHNDSSSSLHPTATTETIPTKTPIEIPTLRQYFRRATRIAQSKALPTAAYEPVSPLGDDSQGKAFPTVFGLKAGQDRENIIKTSALPHDSTQRELFQLLQLDVMMKKNHYVVIVVPQERVCDGAQLEFLSLHPKQETKMALKINARDLEISSFKARIKLLEDKDKGTAELSGDNALIKGRSLETGEEAGVERSTERGKEELHMLIDGLDRNNEVIAKYLQEYEQSKVELTIREKIDLINELVKYQDHHAKILKYQAQQRRPLSKKDQREFYISVFRSYSGWKTKHVRGMTLEEIRENFIPVWKQIEDFVPMASKKEGKRVKRKGLKLKQGSAKKMKTSEDVSEEDLKEMLQLVPVEEVYVEALQLWILVKETLSIRHALSDKEKELWVELKRLFKPDVEDQLDQEIFMLVKKDYPLRRGLAIVMISNKLQIAKMFLRKYFPTSMVTKLRNEITNFRQHPDESLFEAWERYKLSIDQCPNHNMLPVTQIDIFYNGLTLRHRDIINAAAGGTFMKRRLEECYDLIENMTVHHND